MNGSKEREPQARDEHESWVSLEDLERVTSSLPSPLREDVMKRAKNFSEEGMVVRDIEDADELLKEVTRRVFNFSIGDLDPAEIMAIEKIRRDLGIKGDFNPST